MIDHRDSQVQLTPEHIRMRVSDLEIFSRYCRNFKELGRKFKSEFRSDPVPSSVVAVLNIGVRYIDFGFREHSFDSIGYVMFKYTTTFVGAMEIIDRDFGLGLSSGRTLVGPTRYSAPVPRKIQPAKIDVKQRSWNSLDVLYWRMYGITGEILQRFKVIPISHYWINGRRYDPSTITYAFLEHWPRVKIYSPLVQKGKWYSNTTDMDVQGWSMRSFPSSMHAVLASSLKDAMVLSMFGVDPVALQSESIFPKESMMAVLIGSYGRVSVLYDNDFTNSKNPGQRMAERIAEHYSLNNILIPSSLQCKDISDVMAAHGPLEVHRILHGKKERQAYDKEQSEDSGWDKLPF